MPEQPLPGLPPYETAIRVERVVEGSEHTVATHLPALHLLAQLVQALQGNDMLHSEFLVAMANRNPDGRRRDFALRMVANNGAVQDALTLVHSPAEAEMLRDEYDEAQLAPEPCATCGRWLAEFGDQCGPCSEREDNALAQAGQ